MRVATNGLVGDHPSRFLEIKRSPFFGESSVQDVYDSVDPIPRSIIYSDGLACANSTEQEIEACVQKVIDDTVVSLLAVQLIVPDGAIFQYFWEQHDASRQRWYEWMELHPGQGYPPGDRLYEAVEHPNTEDCIFRARSKQLKKNGMDASLWAHYVKYFNSIKHLRCFENIVSSIIELLEQPCLEEYERNYVDHMLSMRPSMTKKQQKIEEKRAVRQRKKGGYTSWFQEQMGALDRRLLDLDKANLWVMNDIKTLFDHVNYDVYGRVIRPNYVNRRPKPSPQPWVATPATPHQTHSSDALPCLVRMAERLRKKERLHARQTAINQLESERHAEVRARCNAIVAEKAARVPATLTSDPSGPWHAPARGPRPLATKVLPPRVRLEIGLERQRQHEEALKSKEARRVAEAARRLEALRLADKIGGREYPERNRSGSTG